MITHWLSLIAAQLHFLTVSAPRFLAVSLTVSAPRGRLKYHQTRVTWDRQCLNGSPTLSTRPTSYGRVEDDALFNEEGKVETPSPEFSSGSITHHLPNSAPRIPRRKWAVLGRSEVSVTSERSRQIQIARRYLETSGKPLSMIA